MDYAIIEFAGGQLTHAFDADDLTNDLSCWTDLRSVNAEDGAAHPI
ncbi:MAG TPA: hypothetical protein VJA94_00615 [Candidatus Angelobacter sp.]